MFGAEGEEFAVWLLVLELCDLAVRIGLAVRVIFRRLAVGVSLAWLRISINANRTSLPASCSFSTAVAGQFGFFDQA